jgi:hypothetical protein
VARRRAVSRSEQQARQAREPTGGDEWGVSEHTGPSMSICRVASSTAARYES